VVALPVLGAAAMLAVLVLGAEQTRRSAQLLMRGEAEVALDAVNQRLRRMPPPVDNAALHRALDENPELGVSYLALLRLDVGLTAESGPRPANLDRLLTLRPGEVERLGELAWAVSKPLPPVARRPPPPPFEGPSPAGSPPDGPPPFGAPPPFGVPPPPGSPPPLGPPASEPRPGAPGPSETFAPSDARPFRDARPPRDGDRGPPVGAPVLLIGFEPRISRQVERAAAATLGAGALGFAAVVLLSLRARSLLRARDAAVERARHDAQLASLGNMSAVLAHEIRNPLASLKGHAQLLVEGLDASPSQHEQARHVVEAAQRLELLTTSLLDLVRAATLERTNVSPVGLCCAVAQDVGKGRVQVEAQGAPQTWSLDAVRFRQVLTNLLENALQAAPSGTVTVRVAQGPEGLVVEVRDSGPGVALADRERIFEPFVTTKVKGTGLGLSIARRLVVLHGGTLRVVGPEAPGATFRVEIPAA
jgi:two-component system, NtrC family, sensor histidine kinase HydH